MEKIEIIDINGIIEKGDIDTLEKLVIKDHLDKISDKN